MQRNKLLRNKDSIVRVLEVKDGSMLIVDCAKKSMPKWVSDTELTEYQHCDENDLYAFTGREILDYDSLDERSRRFARNHFALIAGVIPFINDDKQRCSMVARISEEKNVSKQTIRNYLWLYLAYQDIAALAPKQKPKEKPLTQDEKNMRWALNKFFYTRRKNSLNTAYTMMLKEKYCNQSGVLLSDHPSIYQFRYFFKKHNKMQTYYISREGLKKYQRDRRPLLGDGVQEFAPTIGTGMLDSTVCDIYLVDDAGNLVGRPILTACVDAYSGLCCGYSLSWEGGVYSLRNLFANVIADKVEWCRQFGISIQREEWDCSQLPSTLVTDMGAEYKSANIEQLTELGATIINLAAYRPELKGMVEKFFDLIQSCYKKHLKGKGVIEEDFQERGAKDYRKEACLTMRDFERIILHCIIYYNNSRVLNSFPITKEMIVENVKPHASSIWNWCKVRSSATLISVDYEKLILTLMPRTSGKFNRNGLLVSKLRYRHDAFTERYLQGGVVTVAYNPDNASCVWLLESGEFTEFKLVESRFAGLSFAEIEVLKSEQRNRIYSLRDQNLQAQIDLAGHIEAIANSSVHRTDTNVKCIRRTRMVEQRKSHIDFMRSVAKDG